MALTRIYNYQDVEESFMRKLFVAVGLSILIIGLCFVAILVSSNRDMKPDIIYNTPSSDEIKNSRYRDASENDDSQSDNSYESELSEDVSNHEKIQSNIVAEPNNKDRPINTLNVTEPPKKISPHGFGAYPDLPDRWPSDYWDKPMKREHELIGRVRIKLYNEGKWTDGITYDHKTGLVHPIYKDTIYIRWGSFVGIDGRTHSFIASAKGHPDTMKRIEQYRNPSNISHISQIVSQMKDGDFTGFEDFKPVSISEEDLPSDINFVSYEDGAIDPIAYLGLE